MQDVARFEVRQGDDPGVVASGELDVATVPELKDALTDLIDRHPGTSVWVDMAQVSFIDSSGLGVLVRFNNAATAADYTYTVIAGPPQVHRAFVLSGLDQALPFAAAPSGA